MLITNQNSTLCYVSATGRRFPHPVHHKAAEQEVTCAQDSTEKCFIGRREMCWTINLARHFSSQNSKCTMSTWNPSAGSPDTQGLFELPHVSRAY